MGFGPLVGGAVVGTGVGVETTAVGSSVGIGVAAAMVAVGLGPIDVAPVAGNEEGAGISLVQAASSTDAASTARERFID